MLKDLSTSKILIVLGPTASGKSELAVKIAKKISAYGGGEIISADSQQVYKGLDIGSGKVPLLPCYLNKNYDDISCDRTKCHYIKNKKTLCYKNIPHYLLNVASPKRIFTVSQYQKLAKKALTDILKRGKIPIICGGTGLYIDSIIYGTKFPEVPPQPKLRKKLEKSSTEELFEKLRKLDPRRAMSIDKNNRRRLIRALEIIITTGKQIPRAIRTDSNFNVLKIGVNLPKEKLQRKITKRIKQMFKNELLNEIKYLVKQKLSWNKIHGFGFEYKYPSLFLQKKMLKKEMLEKMLTENWRYAKRQMTWFKKDKNIRWIENEKKAFELIKQFLLN